MHRVDPMQAPAWFDAVQAKVNAGFGYILTGQFGAPDYGGPGVPLNRWGVRISAKDKSANRLADEARQNIALGRYPVIFDEINGLTDANVALAIYYLGSGTGGTTPSPGALSGDKFGAYLVNGPSVDFSVYWNSLDTLLINNGRILVEFYPYYVSDGSSQPSISYNYMGPTTAPLWSQATRDEWLRQFFCGSAGVVNNPIPPGRRPAANRLLWLLNRKQVSFGGSTSIITPIFGVGDQYLGPPFGSDPKKFLDRMFYVFGRITTNGAGALMHKSNDGGVGSWTLRSPDVSSTTRDFYFAESWDWYCGIAAHNYNRASLRGTVPCP